MRWVGDVARFADKDRCIKGFGLGKLEGKRTLGRSKRGRENNIKMYLQKVRIGAWDGLIQDRDR